MKRINLATGLLAMAVTMPVFALTPALPPDATQPVAAAESADTARAALIANDLMLRVSVDNNDAAKAGVPCADYGADSAACATGRFILVNTGQARITGDGWKLYLHSIRRILSIDHPNFSLYHLTGDLYELTPRAGAVTLGPGERIEVPFVAEYWLLRYSDILPRPYVVVANAPPAVLKQDDTDDETRYVDALPAANTNAPLTPAQKFRQQVEQGAPLPAHQVAARALPSPIRQNPGEGDVDVRGLELSLPDLPAGQVEALREHAGSLGLATQGLPVTGAVAPHALPADIAVPGGYRVRIARTGVSIDGYDAAGLYYGVQTVLSLTPAGGGAIPVMTIEDAPRFAHRGMMVDVARNFRQPATLRRLIDQMSAYKLNRLHLHLSDDEGWRIEIPGLPELTEIGGQRCHDLSETRCLMPQLASGPDNRSGGGYLTRDEYIALLRYANDRFVEVIPEIDMPGHSRAAVVSMEARYRRLHALGQEQEANAFRLIDPDDTSNTLSVQFYDRRSNLNPCSSGALNFAGKVIGEIAAMHREAEAPLNVWHFGGDEAKNILLGAGFQPRDGKDADKGRIDMAAQDKPWARSPMCAALLKQENIASVDELPSRFARQVSALVNDNGIETMEAWQDGVKHASGPHDFATKNTMVTLWDTLYWGGADTVQSWTAKGYRGILALPDYLYFDFPYTLDPHERGYYWGSRATDSFKTFSLAPDNLPQNAEVMPDREGKPFEVTSKGPAAHVYGMQGQAWAEVIRNDQQFEYMVYPRLLALAERAWHRADWERPYKEGERYKLGDTDLVDKLALARDWQGFASVVEQRELPKLKRAGIGYREPAQAVAQPGIEKAD